MILLPISKKVYTPLGHYAQYSRWETMTICPISQGMYTNPGILFLISRVGEDAITPNNAGTMAVHPSCDIVLNMLGKRG